MPGSKVNILLAAFNGEAYIADQIKSIIDQTFTNWELYVRDDHSSDQTVNIVKAFADIDLRIHLVEDSFGNLKSALNFSALMLHIKDAEGYVMFADQDDVWLPQKIAITIHEMEATEMKYGEGFPLLVHTNFIYVDSSLKPIESMSNFSALKLKGLQLCHLLAQNPVYGCTMMINRKLLQIVHAIPPAAENHDYWIALVASAFGKIKYIDTRTILYRQHGENISTQYNSSSFKQRMQRIVIDKKNFDDVKAKIKMAEAFKRIYSSKLSSQQLKIVDDFINFSVSKSPGLFFRNIQNGLRRQTLGQTVLFYCTIFFLRNRHYPL